MFGREKEKRQGTKQMTAWILSFKTIVLVCATDDSKTYEINNGFFFF